MTKTEKQVLKDFKKLGYKIIQNDEQFLILYYYNHNSVSFYININKHFQTYCCYASRGETICPIELQEHQLLNELFHIWGWLDDK